MYDVEKLAQRLRSLTDQAHDDVGAAVAILLKVEEEDLSIFLVKRAVNPSDPWSGHMAFPGGRKHSRDEDTMETVVRETLEETGLSLGEYRFLGNLDVQTSGRAGSPLRILPFVFLCDAKPKVALNRELRSWFWVSVDELKRGKGTAVVERNEVPAYVVKGETVWGLTFRIASSLLDTLERSQLT